MCDAARVVTLVASVLALSATASAAQTPHDREREQARHRIDSIAPGLRALLVADSTRTDSLQKASRPKNMAVLDSATIGPFKLFGERSDVALSRRSAQAAWDGVQPLFRNMERDAENIVLVV